MSEHISKQFDAELEAIRTSLLSLGGMVEEQVVQASRGLAEGDLVVLKDVLKREQLVNAQEVIIDDRCNHIIARRQPTAYDLRTITTVMKMVRDLERIGDEAEKIARMAVMIHEANSAFVPRVELQSMSNTVVAMLRKALDAFARLDVASAADVVREDLAVDDQFRSILRQLITFMMEDARTISRSIEILFIAKALERIGDHAKNMSEQVVYLVKGHDVRHQGIDAIMKEVQS